MTFKRLFSFMNSRPCTESQKQGLLLARRLKELLENTDAGYDSSKPFRVYLPS